MGIGVGGDVGKGEGEMWGCVEEGVGKCICGGRCGGCQKLARDCQRLETSPHALSRNRKWYYFADRTIDKNCMTNHRN